MRFTAIAAAIGAGCVLLAGCATPTAKQGPAAAKPPQTVDNSGDHLICRTVDVTGSRMPARECRTSTEWARLKTQGNDEMGIEAQRSLPSKGGN